VTSEESTDPTAIETHGPTLFAIVGVAMIAVAAVGYLADAVSTAFAIVGAGLLVVGGLAGRLLTFKLTATGVEGSLAARQFVAALEQQAQAEGDEETAQAAKLTGEKLDNWYLAFLASPEQLDPNPYVRAAAMQRYYRRQKHEEAD
jgi:hypothetical protein